MRKIRVTELTGTKRVYGFRTSREFQIVFKVGEVLQKVGGDKNELFIS